ncbi:hypothetical protein SHI21_08540 [Bacteriovorax sp. PP10]|uniref:Uncharacterized protein n=1 Tax=Bacteriovorax antarcticus TaxID=3088717 RepID=A0ABU5VTJ3_9BACT|nr:hypothetical protein [Bacteriovorax sp. PP10]MEA9356247.1 hypothetical protein [Bacteriovorax sp. PP10]
MKKINIILPAILIMNCSLATAAEPFQLLEENKMLTAIKTEPDQFKREEMAKKVGEKCPFVDKDSQMAGLLPSSNSLNLSAGMSDQKKAECATYLQNFNKSLEQTKSLQVMVGDTTAELTPEQKTDLENKLSTTVNATSGLRSMIEAQCTFSNSNDEVTNIGNGLISAVEGGSAAVATFNPVVALIGAGAAATGRLVSTLGGWLFGKSKNEMGKEATEADRYISDLCSFRDLAQKYDKIYSDPFEKRLKEKEVPKKKIVLTEDELNLKGCANQLKSSVDKLQEFSVELAAAADKPKSQRQCLSLLNNYNDSKASGDSFALENLSSRYGCSTDEVEKKYVYYCKSLSSIDSMADGDIYTKCESEEFQSSVSAKFVTLSDILFRNVQEDTKKIAPYTDELQRIRSIEESNKVVVEQVDAIDSLLDINPMANLNTAKSMTNLGRNLLGSRFDTFAKNNFKTAGKELKEASGVLDDLVDQHTSLYKKSFFSWRNKSDAEKAKVQKEICSNASQVKRQLANSYRSTAGVKDICDFMKGDGVPALKAPGYNYDSYSAPLSDQDGNLTNRCKEINMTATKNFADIKAKMTLVSSLGCDKI